MSFPGAALEVGGVLVIIQALALAILVASRWRGPGNLSLAVLMALLGLHGLTLLSWGAESPPLTPAFAALTGTAILLYGPLMWRYARSALDPDAKAPLPYALHFAPAALVAGAYGATLALLGAESFTRLAREVFAGGGPAWVMAIEAGKLVQGLSYAIAIVLLWRRNREGLRRWADRRSRVRWLRALAVAFLANWALAGGGSLLRWALPSGSSLAQACLLVQTASLLGFIYVAGFFALRFPSVLEPREAREAIRRALNLPEGFVEESLRRLERARVQGAFADPELDLPGLATRLGLHPNALSFIVNDSLGMGFREYLNASRLEAFLATRRSGSPRGLLEDALGSGFSSKTSFLRAFRARYGTTPSEYLRRSSPSFGSAEPPRG